MFAGIAHNLTIYLAMSTVFFVFGLFTILTRRNAVGVFMGVELVLNAAAINFVAFYALKADSAQSSPWLDGQIFSLFIIVLAAIEAAVALAIVLRVFGAKKNIDPDQVMELRG
ncbi:NADH-quinone oxidoreductase subunit NuoK [bacterium]|nr:NADH-quinone oxidoreductase subunit NuoK [bacterium]